VIKYHLGSCTSVIKSIFNRETCLACRGVSYHSQLLLSGSRTIWPATASGSIGTAYRLLSGILVVIVTSNI